MKSTNCHKITRRQILQGLGAAVTLPTIVPSSVFGTHGTPPPSERITMGCIGLGGQGTAGMGWRTAVGVPNTGWVPKGGFMARGVKVLAVCFDMLRRVKIANGNAFAIFIA